MRRMAVLIVKHGTMARSGVWGTMTALHHAPGLLAQIDRQERPESRPEIHSSPPASIPLRCAFDSIAEAFKRKKSSPSASITDSPVTLACAKHLRDVIAEPSLKSAVLEPSSGRTPC